MVLIKEPELSQEKKEDREESKHGTKASGWRPWASKPRSFRKVELLRVGTYHGGTQTFAQAYESLAQQTELYGRPSGCRLCLEAKTKH